jgi:hypothetical protein
MIGPGSAAGGTGAVRRGRGYNLIQTFEEIETGKGADALDRRPQLTAALKVARQHKAPIIVLCRASAFETVRYTDLLPDRFKNFWR